MITLITGLPGNGKTLYAISTINDRAEKEGRPVYYHGIAELKHDWAQLDNPDEWYKVPDGSIIVIDECQKVFPVRSNSERVPAKCSAFETHRHRGFDIYLITQDRMLFDHHVRALAGQHFHLKRPFGQPFANLYEWQSASNPKDYHELKLAIKTRWMFPKKNFALYKSAEVHTVRRTYPKKLFLIPLLLALIYAAATFAYNTLFVKPLAPKGQELNLLNGLDPPPLDTGYIQQPDATASAAPAAYLANYQPRVADIPASAPIYDAMAQPRTYPRVDACVVIGPRCTCYSQQGTKLKGVTLEFCRSFAAEPEFDYYQEEGHSNGVINRASAMSLISPPPLRPTHSVVDNIPLQSEHH